MELNRRQLLTGVVGVGVGSIGGFAAAESGVLDGTTATSPANKLVPATEARFAEFGLSLGLSMDGSRAVVSTLEATLDDLSDTGAAIVFDRSTGSFERRATLVPETADDRDQVGRAISLSEDGSTVLVGAPNYEVEPDVDAGAGFVFEATEEGWVQRGELVPEDAESDQGVGRAVSVSSDGSTALVAAPFDGNRSTPEAGAAYVFDRVDGGWQQTAKLVDDDAAVEGHVGLAVALSGDGTTALLGAPATAEGQRAGAVYVYDRDAEWRQVERFVPPNGRFGDRFGSAVAVAADGSVALVGSPEHGDHDDGRGYVYERQGGAWIERAQIAPQGRNDGNHVGASVALSADGTTALLGAPGVEGERVGYVGAAYVFERGEQWEQQHELRAADGDGSDVFGEAVALSGDGATALVGAPGDEGTDDVESGSAYTFERPGEYWGDGSGG